jgi:hypothetical protein
MPRIVHGRRLESFEFEHRPDSLFNPAMIRIEEALIVKANELADQPAEGCV